MSELGNFYPGRDESIQLVEYDKIKEMINNKYDSKNTSLEIRDEFEEIFNTLFNSMLETYSHRVFDIIYVMMDEFNITETKAIRYLNEDNKEKVRNFAMNNYHTSYHENKEFTMLQAKQKKKGIIMHKFGNIENLFE